MSKSNEELLCIILKEKKMKNGSDSGSSDLTRKLKFAPKIPVRKHPKPAIVKTELPASKDEIIDKDLLAKLNSVKDDFGRKFKTDKKAFQDQVTFGYGNSSTQARSFGTKLKAKVEDDSDMISQPKDYVEPWDYIRSYYPVTLPLRRPYSGDPEILDRTEFGEGSLTHLPLSEKKINTAQKLGFQETGKEPKPVFLQFPTRLPLLRPPDEEKGPIGKACKLKDLSAGLMGKVLVYRSGKVKMKLGDVLFDVSPGVGHIFSEEVVAVNIKERHYCVIGELNRHAVVTPDVDSLLHVLNDSGLLI